MPDNVPAADASAHLSTDTTVAATPNVTLPVFSTTKVAPWFQRVEALFRLKKVTASQKSDFIIGALPEDVFDRISSWLTELGTDVIPYDVLKTKIIRSCQPSPEEKSQKILDLLKLPLGDQRPSDAFYEIKNLSTVLNPDGTTSMIDLTRVLWMLRLPADIRAQMTNFSTKSEQDLTEHADALKGTTRFALSTLSTPAAAAATDDPYDDDDDHDVIAASQRKTHRSSNQREQRHLPDVSRRMLCYFHKRFGRDARNCRPPCFYYNSKNM